MTRSTRYDKVLQKIPDTLLWSRDQDITTLKAYLLEADGLPRIFIGSGGSLSAAHIAAELSVANGIFATAMTPYQYIFSAWSRLPAKVFAFSSGGRNVDVINAFRTAISAGCQQFNALLMSRPSVLETLMKEKGLAPFSFALKNGDGFLATNSLAAFYALLFRIYLGQTVGYPDPSALDVMEGQLKTFMTSTYTLSTDEWDEHNAALYKSRETDRFYVLYSPDTLPLAVDLESRFSEGSVGCLQISDYRNFAHGRFNWFAQRKGQTAIIALITPQSANVAEGILRELPSYIPVLRLQTEESGAQGIMDLLVKGMHLSKWLGRRWGLDLGAPKVAEFGRIIHRKDFMDPDGI